MTRASATRGSFASAAALGGLNLTTPGAARIAVITAGVLAATGAAFGLLVGGQTGSIVGPGAWLVAGCLAFSVAVVALVAVWPLERIAPIAATATAFYGAYLGALAVYAALDPHSSETLFVALIWFTPLQAFNRIVNRGRSADILAWLLPAAPPLILVLLWPWIVKTFPLPLVSLAIVFALVHVTSALMINILWRYREAFMTERELSARFRLASEVLDKATDAIIIREINGPVTYWNESAARMFGFTSEEAVGRPIHEVLRTDPSVTEEATAKVLESGEWRRVVTLTGAEGVPIVLDGHMTLVRNAAGQPTSILSISTDITARVAIEERLRQAERLEAVGQLTGGVAHDFNNLLTVILGNAEALNEELSGRADLLDLGEMIGRAAARGAALTHQLLAFAQRQPLDPRPIDPNALLKDTSALLRRTLREDVTLSTPDASGVWHVLVDPAQLENALLNLCLNARDAMPLGGTLTIEVANVTLDQDYADKNVDVTPGDYVRITVTDSGIGIPPENLRRVFDPFFTTKEFGKGTGLGLSMVYGFIKQSHGHIAIYSELGHGASVKMFLPRAVDVVPEVENASVAPSEMGGSETVLVVEDDDMLRANVARQLTGLGYEVITSANGLEALEVIRSGVSIDLLFTDVIMPGGLSGPALAKAARELMPNLRLLYTSGYTENAIVHQGRLDSGIQLLAKPYMRADLALKVRAVLDAPP